MQKKHRLWIGAIVAIVVLLVACTPPQLTAPVPTPTSQTPASSGITPTPTTVTAEDVAWAKIIQDAKKEGQVFIYSFAFIGDAGVAVSKAFKDKYGIKVDIVAGSAPIMLERLRSEYRSSQFVTDIADMNASRALELKNDKLSLSTKDLPVLSDKASWYNHPLELDPDGYVLCYFNSTATPYINTTLVKPAEEPQSWFDLLQPRWKGKVMVGDPGIYLLTYYTYYGLVRKSNRLNEDYFRQLGGQIGKFVPGSAREQVLALVRGEGPLHFSTSETGGAPLIAEGAPIKALSMKEGAVFFPSQSLTMLSKAPHPNAARLFINWFLSADGLKIFAESASQVTRRKDVPNYLPNAARVDQSTAINLDFKDLDEINKLYNAGYLTKLWKGETGK